MKDINHLLGISKCHANVCSGNCKLGTSRELLIISLNYHRVRVVLMARYKPNFLLGQQTELAVSHVSLGCRYFSGGLKEDRIAATASERSLL